MTTRPEPVAGSYRADIPLQDYGNTFMTSTDSPSNGPVRRHHLPFHREEGQHTPGIKPEGESFRKGVHPFKFLNICYHGTSRVSKVVNLLWPFVPAAIALHFVRPNAHMWIFILNYIAIIPAANLLGFAGKELGRKIPRVFGVLLETTLGSIVEIILFVTLISKGEASVPIIKAAILGSILANLLLCLGMCFLVGGLRREEQEFHEAVSEVGSNLMLVAGMGLIVPAAFSTALASSRSSSNGGATVNDPFHAEVLKISRATAIVLLVAYFVYIWFQMRSHHSMYDEVLERDEEKDEDRHRDTRKDKLTLTECVIALVIALSCVSLSVVFLVEQIEFIVHERHIKDAFLGLILVPLVEKLAEHLTAIDEAWDNTMNLALSHVMGATIQTALFNTPLVVLIGWGLHRSMDLRFETFDAIVLILAILVVGNFLRDGKSNYLEGVLCVFVYIIIAIAAFYYPNPPTPTETASSGHAATENTTANATSNMAARLLARGFAQGLTG